MNRLGVTRETPTPAPRPNGNITYILEIQTFTLLSVFFWDYFLGKNSAVLSRYDKGQAYESSYFCSSKNPCWNNRFWWDSLLNRETFNNYIKLTAWKSAKIGDNLQTNAFPEPTFSVSILMESQETFGSLEPCGEKTTNDSGCLYLHIR